MISQEDHDFAATSHLRYSPVALSVDQEPLFVRRDGGSSLFKCGDNVACTVVGYPQRGPQRRDEKPTLHVTYSRSRVPRRRRVRKIGSVLGTKAALRTAQGMMLTRPMLKTRIRFKVHNIQHGPSESESAVNATSLALLQSSYDLKDVHTAVSYTKDHIGNDLFFPAAAALQNSKKDGRPRYQLHFNVKLDVIWLQVSGPSTADQTRRVEEVCREAARTIFAEFRLCAAGKLSTTSASA
ncbi:hypothetical protein BV898_11696 [Hypsibius exemplaris]|uniref:Exoribonuclease phosphorolytic domain-containing protein n=1 Tax=Hypsibius exemplaris TaxID=2072580 RepID=A0A1W0WFZ6_HYPEX|nr:hypothetical protein BV898_11696 [Hypsibius exemplaris]